MLHQVRRGLVAGRAAIEPAAAVAAALDGTTPSAAFSLSRFLLTAYAGAKYDDTTGAITKVYDQTVNDKYVNDGATSTRRPTLSTAGPNSIACADFDGSSDYLTGFLPTDYITNASAWMVVSGIFDAITEPVTVNFATVGHALIASSGGTIGLFACDDAGIPKIYAANYVSGASDTRVSAVIATGTAYVLSLRHEGGVLYLSVNGAAEVSIASGNTSSLTGTLRFGFRGNAFFDGKLFEGFTYKTPNIPAATPRAAILANLMSHIGA